MRTCPACGTPDQSDGAKFCLECGNALEADPTCSGCGAELPPTGKFCPGCGTAREARPAAPTGASGPGSGAARKITSVLFGDLVGFTTISESRDPEEVRELLTAYFDECRAVVSRYGGELEKFIGDAVMAVWGLPVTREDDAERAVRAGLELVERVQALGDRIDVAGLNMRVGITTAEVAVTRGATGQGMVAGDPVNTAARIQSTAHPGEVWVDETTRAFSASSISYADAGAHAMKGKAEPVPLWKVRAVVAGVGGDRRDDGLEAPLTGRDRELRLVKEVFHGVQETHRPGMLVIDGEAGIGKSRLGWEFEKYVDGFEANVLWHRGRCLSYGEGVAYYALAEAVRSRVAVLAGAEPDADSAYGDLLPRALLACVPDATERQWLEPRLGALLGLAAGTSYPREDLFVAWTTFFKYVGQSSSDTAAPVVLVIDDAQYADAGLLAFLEHLLAAADYPVFVLGLARPELLAEHPGLVGNRRVTVVHLEPLTAPEMARLLDALVSGVPQPIRDELVTRAAGVPLFAIETVRSLVDQGLVVAGDGGYLLSDPDTVDLGALTAPASLQALIGARLDTLPADERKVVDRASVLGVVFTDDGIAALCADVADLHETLGALVRREVLRRETDRLSADYGSYKFVQGAVRQVAYGMLSRRDRKATHLDVARAFEAELEARSDAYELAPIIAQHYLDAIEAVPADPDVPELTRAASDQLERAADRAASLGAPREAAGHLAKALEHAEPERRLALQGRLARQLRIAGDNDRAIQHAAEALKGYEAVGDVIGAAGPAEDLARALVYSDGDLNRAITVLRDLTARVPDQPDTLDVRLALANATSAVLLRSGDSAAYADATWHALRLAEQVTDVGKVAEAWSGVAISSQATMPRTSRMLLERAAELAAESRALRPRGIALVNLTAGAGFDDTAAAVRHGRDAIAAASELGEAYMLAMARFNLAQTLLLTGEWTEAVELVENEEVGAFLDVSRDGTLRAVALARAAEGMPSVAATLGQDPDDMDDPLWGAEYDLDLALEALATGSTEAAALAVRAARAAGDATSNGGDFWPVWLAASQVVRETGDRAALAEIVAFVGAQNGPWPTGIVAQRTRLEAIAGQDGSRPAEEVEADLRRALDLTRAWRSPLYEAHVHADLGRWLRDTGRAEEAGVLIGHARAFYEGIGAVRWLDELS
ncbi:adenylate/guanylate cyclase domain-containing protein [Marmoricola sp. RAF53]|uniref:adenylate/guanylate cyclase domain-containing protein n=1 Tax=Marmoricola sp. RAF53 TaxID=3233059 RepID=UPI003F9CD3C3